MLDAATRAKLQKRLEEAEDAQHTLAIGGQAKVFVDQNGERVEYASATALGLTKYIFTLKAQLGLLNTAGPVQPWM